MTAQWKSIREGVRCVSTVAAATVTKPIHARGASNQYSGERRSSQHWLCSLKMSQPWELASLVYHRVCKFHRGEGRCLYKDCPTVQDARPRSKSAGDVYCQHISSVQELSSDFEALKELAPVLGEASSQSCLPSIMSDLHNLKEGVSSLTETVSSESFAVRDKGCSKEPLGLLHVRFRNSEPRPTFYCPCHTFQRFSAQLPGAGTTAKPSRRCLHFYVCGHLLVTAPSPKSSSLVVSLMVRT